MSVIQELEKKLKKTRGKKKVDILNDLSAAYREIIPRKAAALATKALAMAQNLHYDPGIAESLLVVCPS